MESPQSPAPAASFFKKNGKIFTIAIFVLVGLGLGTWFFLKKDRPADYNQQYAKYIEAYTSGTISKKSFIRLHLASEVKTMNDVGVADSRDLFSFSPSVKGKTYWIDAQTVEFRPDEPLAPGEDYEATFDLAKVTETEAGLDDFEFDFRVIKPGMSFSHQGLVSQNNTAMDYMKLKGEISTSDQEDPKHIEKALELDFKQPLKIKWQHNPEKNTYAFTIDSIKKSSSDQVLKLEWSGDPIDAEAKGEIEVTVPKAGVFKILDMKAIQDQEDYALVQFSEPIGVGQDLTGMIALVSSVDLRFTIDGSQVKVYAAEALKGNYTLTVNEGVENINGKTLSCGKICKSGF